MPFCFTGWKLTTFFKGGVRNCHYTVGLTTNYRYTGNIFHEIVIFRNMTEASIQRKIHLNYRIIAEKVFKYQSS